MLKIGLLGAGHLGKIHLKCIQGLPEYDLVGFYDPDEAIAKEVSEKYGVPCFESEEALIQAAEVIDIVTPTIQHYRLAKLALEAGKHLFIEKPLTDTLEEAESLMALNEKQGLKVQVGHVERFNPAMLALKGEVVDPMFIEAHRLAAFNPRGTDVSVVLDLMIHDLDIVLHLVQSEVKLVHASGVAVLSDRPDICNARIEFANGCVANLTASRISMKQMRKLRLFQQDAYISMDFLKKETQIIRLHDEPKEAPNVMELSTNKGTKYLEMAMPPVEAVNAIQLELKKLAESIEEDKEEVVPMKDGYAALKLAHQILTEVEKRLKGAAL